jgi:hypothetical protein
MAGRKVHIVQVCDIPCRYYYATTVRVVLNSIHSLLNLVDEAPVVIGPRTPLVAIYVTEVASFWVGPLVPDAHTSFLKPLGIGIALKEPQQFVDDAFKMYLLCGKQGEAFLQIKTHLMTKDALGTGTCSVTLVNTFLKDTLK